MIDTAAKRRSCIGIGLLFLRTGIAPTGGDISAVERLHVQGLYVGIAPPAPPTSGRGNVLRRMVVSQSYPPCKAFVVSYGLDGVMELGNA